MMIASRRGTRANQKWFDSVEVDRAGGIVERRKFGAYGDVMDWYEGNYYRNGFGFKEVRLLFITVYQVSVYTFIRTQDVNLTLEALTYNPSHVCYRVPSQVSVSTFIRTQDVNPTLEELTKFRSRSDKAGGVSDEEEEDEDGGGGVSGRKPVSQVFVVRHV
jgi:hypothetical protein